MMPFHGERTYRKRVRSPDFVSFQVTVKETDLWVSADRALEKETRDLVFDCRHQLETYIQSHPEFAKTLFPWEDDPYAPPVVREMIAAAMKVGVGPMAAVAGAIAQYVGWGLLERTDQVIVENGGDVFMKANRPVTVSIYAGDSPLSEKFGLLIPLEQMPMGVCSSSGTVGHSLSTGKADVICILSASAALGDAVATALGNKMSAIKDLDRAASWAKEMEGISGGVVIMGERMATWGDVELVALSRP